MKTLIIMLIISSLITVAMMAVAIFAAEAVIKKEIGPNASRVWKAVPLYMIAPVAVSWVWSDTFVGMMCLGIATTVFGLYWLIALLLLIRYSDLECKFGMLVAFVGFFMVYVTIAATGSALVPMLLYVVSCITLITSILLARSRFGR